jgi:hypothetical protein
MKKMVLIAGFVWVSAAGFCQLENRLRPGQMYEPGQEVYAPKYGFKSKVPEGWEGTLPREAEIFVLMPLKAVSAQIYVWGTEKDKLEELKKRWTTGMDMGDGIILKSKGAITARGAGIAAEGELKGATNTASRKIYAEARCSEFGICITYILSAENSYDEVKASLQQFVDNTVFDAPRNVSIYEGFDWKKFLTGRMLITYESNENARKLNEVHFCQDGTFSSEIRRKGLMKDELKPYQGKKKGTWSVGSGQTSVLVLQFDKGPRAEVELTIKDEKVFANGVRHFVAYSEKCDK